MLSQPPGCEVALGLLIDFDCSERMDKDGAAESIGTDTDNAGDKMVASIARNSGKLPDDVNSEADEDEDIGTLENVWTVCCICLTLQRKVVLNFRFLREHLHLWPLKPSFTLTSL
jgi:hypothetical protein